MLATPLRRTLLTTRPTGLAARLAARIDAEDVLLHGTADADVAEFAPQRQTDFDGNRVTAVFATDDPIWATFFAIVNRAAARSLVNGCFRVRGETRYFFSVSADPAAETTWRDGWIYVLPRATFTRHRSGPEWLSPTAVRPLERLRVTPADFPFLAEVSRHGPGEPLPLVVARATILRKRR